MDCTCPLCHAIFPHHRHPIKAIQEKLTKSLMQGLATAPEIPRKGTDEEYVYRPKGDYIVGKSMERSPMEVHANALNRVERDLNKWLGRSKLHRQWGNVVVRGLPQIHTIILDASQLFAGTTTAEYYIDLSITKPRMLVPRETNRFATSRGNKIPLDGANFPYSMEETLIADISGFELHPYTTADMTQRIDIADMITLLAEYRAVQGHTTPTKVYFIVGCQDVQYPQPCHMTEKQKVHKFVRWLIGLTPDRHARITWMGMGIAEPGRTYNKDKYREITIEMGRCHATGQCGHRFFNIFSNLSGDFRTGRLSEEDKETVRTDLIPFLETGRPRDLPEWVYPKLNYDSLRVVPDSDSEGDLEETRSETRARTRSPTAVSRASRTPTRPIIRRSQEIEIPSSSRSPLRVTIEDLGTGENRRRVRVNEETATPNRTCPCCGDRNQEEARSPIRETSETRSNRASDNEWETEEYFSE